MNVEDKHSQMDDGAHNRRGHDENTEITSLVVIFRCLVRRKPLLLLVVICLLALVRFSSVRGGVAGDGVGYFIMLEALFQHGSPDQRSEDILAVKSMFKSATGDEQFADDKQFYAATNGKSYNAHFWMYPLFALPIKALLHLSHIDFRLGPFSISQFDAFRLTNVLLLCWAVCFSLKRYRAGIARRLMFVGLCAASPVLWYINWPHPEVYTWSFVVVGLVHLSNRRLAWSAVCFSFAAMQNPPLLFMVLYVVALAWYERRIGPVVMTTGGGMLSALPMAFYYILFGHPNLIAAKGFADIHNISPIRTWSILTDLNQGFLPYVPILLFLTVSSVILSIINRRWSGIAVSTALFLAILSAETTSNWNAGCAGLMRYAIWMLPVCAWLTIEHIPDTHIIRACVIIGIVLQIFIVWGSHFVAEYTEFSWLARFTLNHVPVLYNPEPEIFIERVRHSERPSDHTLPVAFVSRDGIVTKILLDGQTIPLLPRFFIVDQAYMDLIKTQNSPPGLFYLNPPRGVVRSIVKR